MSLLEETLEEPIDVFYQCWSKLADHMLAGPSLNMYQRLPICRDRKASGYFGPYPQVVWVFPHQGTRTVHAGCSKGRHWGVHVR